MIAAIIFIVIGIFIFCEVFIFCKPSELFNSKDTDNENTSKINISNYFKPEYENPTRVLCWDDLVPWQYKSHHSIWTTKTIITPNIFFEHLWDRIKNGRDFKYYVSDYDAVISFYDDELKYITLKHDFNTIYVGIERTGIRYSLPYCSDKKIVDYNKELNDWFYKIILQGKKEWEKDNNI